MFASITQVQSYYSFFILLLDETIMAQNNLVFVFVRRTSNESRGRQNFRIDMNQVRNLKSLGFTWKKKANLFRVSPSFWFPCFCNRPFCGRWCCKTSICISYCVGRCSTAPTLWSSLLSSFLPPALVLGNSFSNSYWTDGCWFSFISPFAMFAKSINDFTISFGTSSLFMILFIRGTHWPPAVFIVLTN